tara:strand:+ start:330 stop:455 length:126 start_codon:yes stop_codon:yes gene_type:complete
VAAEEDGLVAEAVLAVLEPVQDFQFLMLLLTQSLLVAVVLV